ncbi:MAG: LLM class flavin-dependent oxidoreductase [Acidimicrobiaceae bacterium]|nr:LLM class flavin-dependent oxidoreductase [Acidimicrobiaceae bacterium]
MRFSFVTLPDYPLSESLEHIRTADELGFYGCYAADETWHKDLYVLFAAAASQTSRIRMGPSLAPIALREPTLVAQAVATLDELTGGRAECVISSGNFSLLAQYATDWTGIKPLSRVKEAHQVMRTFLDEGALTFEGEFFNYAGLFTFARPVQEHLPLLIGALRGPKSFQAAGELSDGTHAFAQYSQEACSYMVDNLRIGAERAGKNVQDLDIAVWNVFAVGPDSAKAKQAAQTIGAFYIPAMASEQMERHGVSQSDVQPILEAFGDGDVQGAIDNMTVDIAEKLSVAGTPEEVVEKIKSDIEPSGVNHFIACITDSFLLNAFTGRDIEVPDVQGQLQLIHDEVMPAFN